MKGAVVVDADHHVALRVQVHDTQVCRQAGICFPGTLHSCGGRRRRRSTTKSPCVCTYIQLIDACTMQTTPFLDGDAGPFAAAKAGLTACMLDVRLCIPAGGILHRRLRTYCDRHALIQAITQRAQPVVSGSVACFRQLATCGGPPSTRLSEHAVRDSAHHAKPAHRLAAACP